MLTVGIVEKGGNLGLKMLEKYEFGIERLFFIIHLWCCHQPPLCVLMQQFGSIALYVFTYFHLMPRPAPCLKIGFTTESDVDVAQKYTDFHKCNLTLT